MARPSSFEPIGGAALGLDRVAPSLFDYLPLGIVVTDSHGEILEANQAAHDLLGLGDGKKCDLLFLNADGSALPPADHPSARAVRDQCVLADQQVGMEGPEGDPIWFQVTATPLPGVGVVTTYHNVTPGRRTEEDLRHHIDQLDAFFDTNLDLLAILNSDGRAVRLNPAWGTLLGYDLEQLDGARVLDFTHPSDMESTLGALARLRTRKEVVGFVSRMRHRKGSYRFLEWRATAGEDLIYATARDITDYRLAEAALRESEARFRAIFEQATVGVAEADSETGSYVRINQRFCDILGYSRDELMATGLDSLTHPKDLPQDLAILKGIQEDGNRVPGREKRCLHKDGNTVWINLQVTALSESDTPTPHIVVVIEDISQRKKTDELLHNSLADVIETNQRLNFQVTRMPFGYIAWDLEYHVTVWNASAERIFGWTAAEAVGRHVYHLMFPPEERAKTTQFWDAVVEGSDSSSHSLLGNCTRDGRRITCEWFGAPDIDASGRIVGCLSMVHDVTERIRVEEKVLHSQRMESLGSFAGGVAHDMNNVLRTIMDVAGANQVSTPDAETLGKRMDKVLQACVRGRTLVRGLLDFSRQDLTDAKILDLNEVLEDQLRFLGRSIPPSVRVQREFDANLRTMRGDAFALSGAIMHLLMNALDAMPEGGLLTLRTRMVGLDEVQMDLEDTGSGMTKDVLERAIEPFFTTKLRGKGAGLGLPAVYGAVKAHQGTMEIHSEPGRGTQVQITLPVSQEGTKDQTVALDRRTEGQGLRILLVDDDNLVQTAVCAQLRKLGHAITIANHGQQALDKLQEGLEFDLVLLDIDMPVLSGGETLPRLRALRPSLPVIIETGNMGEQVEQLARAFADVSVLGRPFSLSELKAALAPWANCVRAGGATS
jgi:two-component system cell cycle sensor histidine kinase/response regulator CckA